MPVMPFQILGIWFRGLLSIAIVVGSISLFKRWYDDSYVTELVPVTTTTTDAKPAPPDGNAPPDLVAAKPGPSVFRFQPGWNRPTAELAGAVALLLWATVGGWIDQGLSRLLGGTKAKTAKGANAADEDPREEHSGESHTIQRPDGSVLHVECYGPAGAPPIVMTHGWGCNSAEWFYPKKDLPKRFRLILWDEPGLGQSKKPDNNDYRLETFAGNLEAVLQFAGARPAILVGHSIGGMVILTLCKVLPAALSSQVAGLVLVNTSYTNPVRTTKLAPLYTALEKPVLIPLLYLTIAVWPLVYLMNWMSYFNGSLQRSTRDQSFGGTQTQGQVDFCARFMAKARPDVLARGMLGMIAYDATAVLPSIPVPTMVVVGDQDTTTLPEAGQYIARNVPRAQLATLSPAKHMSVIEHHAQFDEMVASFADSCLTTSVTT